MTRPVGTTASPRPRRRSQRPLSLLVPIIGLFLVAACGGPAPEPTPTVAPEPASSPLSLAAPSPPVASPLPSPSPGLAPSPSPSPIPLLPQPFAVMIDNIDEARPHAGLASADVVYEAPAEGGIPRLLAVFLTRPADRIGPVRSARPYFVELANEFRVPLVHIGASPQGFDMMEQTGIERVDESRGDGGFTRDPNRAAPHDAFVSTASIAGDLTARGVPRRATWAGLTFGAFVPGTSSAQSLRIPYPCCVGFVAEYAYDAASKTYARSMDGQPHRDEVTGEQYAPTSVIVQFASVAPIPDDDAGRLDVTLVGSGKGLLVSQGTRVPLRWSKASIQAPTRFAREDGAPLVLPVGQVWIEVVPTETNVTAS